MPVSLLVSLAVRSMHASPRSAADCLDLPKSNSTNYLGVPVTIESGVGEKSVILRTYRKIYIFPDQVYPAERLVVADELDEKCSQTTSQTDKGYALLPEIWSNDCTVIQVQKAVHILLDKRQWSSWRCRILYSKTHGQSRSILHIVLGTSRRR